MSMFVSYSGLCVDRPSWPTPALPHRRAGPFFGGVVVKVDTETLGHYNIL